MDKPEPGAGDIPILLDGKQQVLQPSLQACLTVSKLHGGLNAAVQRCAALDFETICAVITAGLGLNPTQARMIPEAVYRTGTIQLYGPCVDFIHVIANGGRPIPLPDPDGENGGEEVGDEAKGPLSP